MYEISIDPALTVYVQWFVVSRTCPPTPLQSIFPNYHPLHKNATKAKQFVSQRFTQVEAEALKSDLDNHSYFDTRITREELPLSINAPIPFLYGTTPLRFGEGWMDRGKIEGARFSFIFGGRFRVPIAFINPWAKEQLIARLPARAL